MSMLAPWLLLFAAQAAGPATVHIVVEAGSHDRKDTPVSAAIQVPATSAGATWAILEDPSGRTLQGQIASGRELRFILPELKAGRSASYAVTFIREPSRVDARFAWTEASDGSSYELSLGTRPLLRYVCPAIDESTRESREETFKVFHHLYDPRGERLVTKGPGGLFPHHRGIFYGWNQVSYGDGRKCDVWHCTGTAFQAHEQVLLSEGGPVYGRHRVKVGWHGAGKELFAVEERDLSVYALPAGTMVEFVSQLTPVIAPVTLDGDPQHAGLHFRAASEVADKTKAETYFLRPDGRGGFGQTRNWPQEKEHVNLPWDAMSFVLGSQRYTVAYLDRPDNPKEARYSEREYGRIGSYFRTTLSPGQALLVRYRLWLQSGEMTPEGVARLSDDFVDPPKVTVR